MLSSTFRGAPERFTPTSSVSSGATLASNSRSVTSFQVQPAPRMMTAPSPNSTKSSSRCQSAGPGASARLHQHGNSRSHVPIGRSSRMSRA